MCVLLRRDPCAPISQSQRQSEHSMPWLPGLPTQHFSRPKYHEIWGFIQPSRIHSGIRSANARLSTFYGSGTGWGPGEHNMIKTTHALHHKELQSLGGGRHKPTITRSTSRVLGTLAFFPSKIAAEKDFYLGLQSTNVFHDHEDSTVTKSRVKPQAPPGSSRTWLLPVPSPLLNPQKDQGSPCTLRVPPHSAC